ncbi:MAG: helicase HerA-like domain-containing protein, partial [Rudaea sp.]
DGGVPLPVERALIVPPTSRIGTISDAERATIRSRSPVGGKYDSAVDRESAYEILSQRTNATAASPVPGDATRNAPTAVQSPGWGKAVSDAVFGTNRRQGMIEALAKSAARNAGGRLGSALIRGVLGSLLRK